METSVVTDHRMAFSMSPQQTVLWDQLAYSGNPTDFSWVLPVRAGTVVQESHDEWFEALDATTTPVISGPARNCNGGGLACGGSSKQSASGFAAAGGGGVQVLSQSVVGPYDTATLAATDPNALENWLNTNGYLLPDSFRPTIAAYVAGGFDFIALRLMPGQGVQAMKPVRVVTQGADVSLPLRMVAAGVGAQVGITLYVISEGRYEAASPFFNATIDDSQLTWSATQNISNYQTLSQQIMQGHAGHTWLTEFSGLMSLVPSQPVGSGPCGNGSSTFFSGDSLADVYVAQCPCQLANAACAAPGEAGAADATSESDGTAPDATLAPEAAACPDVPCAGFDDLDVALVGLHPENVWVTRLRSLLPLNALAESDLQIQASASQTPVSNLYSANEYDDPTYSPCGTSGGCAASGDPSSSLSNWLVVGTFGFLGVALFRRRRSPLR